MLHRLARGRGYPRQPASEFVWIMRDRIDGVVEAIQIGRRSLAIARQSMIAGMGLSLLALGFAAAGLITPVAGGLLQEAIDVAVIVNALRALHA